MNNRHWLLSHIAIIEIMHNSEREINPVEMTITNPWKEYWPNPGSNQQPLILKSCTLPTEVRDSAQDFRLVGCIGV